VAYKLRLPETSKIHLVVHVSQLKKSVPSTVTVKPALPQATLVPQMPERILAKRWRALGNSSIREALVQWTGMNDKLATWENLQELQRRFPAAPAWGQVGFQRQGDVMNPDPRPSKKHR
jgi:hypothetical protein